MGRKRNQGKARRAAKAKAKQEAEERDNETIDERRQQLPLALAGQMQLMQSVIPKFRCSHGLDDPSTSEAEGTYICTQFCEVFYKSFEEAFNGNATLSSYLTTARDATIDEYADVWSDSTKLEWVISYFLFIGTDAILEGDDNDARGWSVIARYFEQYIAVALKQSQPTICWPKVVETCTADLHTLVKFFRHRIPCSCLDDKYEEVKHIPKMGFCYNKHCTHPGGRVERSKTMYCSRCRRVTYCSRECQVAHWPEHKPHCDCNVEIIAEFDARLQNTLPR